MNAELDTLAANGSDMLVQCPMREDPGCPNPAMRVTLVADWRDRVNETHAYIPIIGCGNPWHYVADFTAIRPEGEITVRLTVERVRAAVRDVRQIDWLASDDLSRYAREVLINLTIGPVPPQHPTDPQDLPPENP